ncbi:hexose kinase [Pararhodobacter sp. SW119]|uniref:1-phosphofructokinase family hexose kinase n=1 Tax=Pararhodobacter sp. SW119 TaxID=2780075 RepID=UPI001AE05F21|nr:hexose kinase [Pararhodobacter sp. SW119]
MPPILTVTLNPALDISGHVPRIVAGPKLRVRDVVVEPGGGGVNVARAIQRLGGAVAAFVVLGGPNGERLAALLSAEGVALRRFDLPGDTRESLAVTDDDGRQYRFVLPGPEFDAARETAVRDAIVSAALEAERDAGGQGGWVVLSGSQPPGMGDDFEQGLAQALAPCGACLIVDTSGSALDRLTRQPSTSCPAVLRMDQAESEALAGRALASPAESLDLACDMVRRGVAGMVVLARGAEGSVLAAPDLRLHCAPPTVEVVSPVGAGDSFTAAFTLALARGGDPAEALRQGTAAAAAAVMTPGSELCRAADVARLASRCRVVAA